MKISRFLLILACTVSLLGGMMAGSAIAVPSIPLDLGPFYADYQNYEVLGDTQYWDRPNDQAGDPAEDNWGIVYVEYTDLGLVIPGAPRQIIDPDFGAPANNTWNGGDLGLELTGIFYGVDIVTFSPGAVGGTNAIGGQLDLYLNPAGTLNLGTLSTADRYDITAGVGDGFTNITDTGVLWLSTVFLPDPVSGFTIVGTVNGTIPPFTGSSQFYLGATGGLAFQYFDTDYWGDIIPGADLFARNNFSPGLLGGFNHVSDDPVTGYVTPEPASMLLLGSGLLGLAGIGRRRFRMKD